jgi:hypothetical protein
MNCSQTSSGVHYCNDTSSSFLSEGNIDWLLLFPNEEHRLRVFENRVLRRIFGPKRDEVTGG